MKTFGCRLKKIRKKNRYTIEQLSKKINISKQSICNYENNVILPKASIVSEIAKLFNVSVDYLCMGVENNNSAFNENKIDIKNELEKIKNRLSMDKNILFDGEPMCKEARNVLFISIEIGIELVKRNQQKK